jgi:hypothetical protein
MLRQVGGCFPEVLHSRPDSAPWSCPGPTSEQGSAQVTSAKDYHHSKEEPGPVIAQQSRENLLGGVDHKKGGGQVYKEKSLLFPDGKD